MNLKKAWKAFWTPRFTTLLMEISKTRCGDNYQIASMFFEDNRPHEPVRALGVVNTAAGRNLKVTWNQYGECQSNGKRLKEYDLVHPDQNEINAAKTICLSLVFIIITLFFLI